MTWNQIYNDDGTMTEMARKKYFLFVDIAGEISNYALDYSVVRKAFEKNYLADKLVTEANVRAALADELEKL